MVEEKTPDLILPNKLYLFYDEEPLAEGLSLDMFVGSKANEKNKELIFAVNHIIEHSLRPADAAKASLYQKDNVRPQDCITSYDNIRFGKYLERLSKLMETLNCYGDMFSKWHMPYLEAERNVIFEEWCDKRQNGNPAFLSAYLGSKEDLYTLPERNLILLKPEYIEKYKDTIIKDWFNHQINYTKNLRSQDVIDYAKHICGADNMAFVASGNMPKKEFLNLAQQSTLIHIPQTQAYNPFENMTDAQAQQNLSSNLNIDDYKVSSLEITYPSNNPEESKIAKEFFKLKIGKGLQKEEPFAYVIDFKLDGISTRITSQKEKMMQEKLVFLMASSVKDFSLSDVELQVLQNRLGMHNLSSEKIQNIVLGAFLKAQLSVNEAKPKPVAILANMQNVRLQAQENIKTPLKSKTIPVNISSIQYSKDLQASK